ncbi:MAG: glycosyltransferase family 87 protein [Anaerolineaceae bacterium]|nr:glycosyltransferase family 87 protein [Anaerolineaceae bacterium]
MRLRNSANLWFPFVMLVTLVGLTFLNLELQQRYKASDDFAPRYAAARLWMQKGFSPYAPEVSEEAKRLQKDHGFTSNQFDQGSFIEPVFYLLVYLPLSFLPFMTARAIWMAVSAVSYLISVYLAFRLAEIKLHLLEAIAMSLLLFVWYPSFKLILTASILPPFIALTLLACYLGLKMEGTAAGVFLFLCFGILPISVPLAVFLMIIFAGQRDSSLLTVYLVGIGFLILISSILFPGWIAAWFANFIKIHPDLSWVRTPLLRLAEFFPGAKMPIAILLHGLVLFAFVFEWYGLRHYQMRNLRFKLMITFLLLYLFNLTSHGAYLIFLLPALFLSFRFLREKWRIFGKITAWVIYLALVFFYWKRFASLGTWTFEEPSLIVLLLPLITLVGLQWFRWWATKSPRAIVESKP